MKLFRALVDSGTSFRVYDAIEHVGGLWLVQSWINDNFKKVCSPGRLIRIDVLPHQVVPFFGTECLDLADPLPDEICNGRATSANGVRYEVIEAPELEFSMA